MKHTNYFCGTCFKTFTEYYNGQILCDKDGTPTPKDSPLTTGKCDNTDPNNLLIIGKICGGKLLVD